MISSSVGKTDGASLPVRSVMDIPTVWITVMREIVVSIISQSVLKKCLLSFEIVRESSTLCN